MLLIGNAVPPAVQPVLSTVQQEGEAALSFPLTVPGTTLIANRVASYDGPFMEDGSGEEVFGVAALELYNAGSKGILQAEIVLMQGESTLIFLVETLPPGQTVLVPEMNKSANILKKYTECTGWQQTEEGDWWASDAPRIIPVGMGTLEICNTRPYPLRNLWISYKNHISSSNMYIGGVTYQVGIRYLEAGETLQINPPHYVRGYSRILRVTAGESP